MRHDRECMIFVWILGSLLAAFTGYSDVRGAEDPTYDQLMEQAQKDRAEKNYGDSAVMAARAFLLADKLANAGAARQKAAELSASSGAEARKAGEEISGAVSIVIDPSAGKLYLFEGETIRKIFDLLCNPAFILPRGKYIAGPKLSYPNYELNGIFRGRMEKENPLGARWIEIRDQGGKGVFGIHGRKDGTKENLIFFSLQNGDVIELSGLLAEGAGIEVK